MRHFNQLHAAEDERLSLLSEEAGEVVSIIGKVTRHGYESSNPLIPGSQINRFLLQDEIGDFMAAVDLLCTSGDLNRDQIEKARMRKHKNMRQWLHHQPESLLKSYSRK